MSNWIVAISLTFPSQAHMVQGFLESEGIDTMLKDEFTTQVHNFYSNAVGGVKILVKEEDFENSQLILHRGGYLNPISKSKVEVVFCDEAINKKVCPFCRSENIGRRKDPDVFMLVVSLILGLIFPIFKKTNLCFDCGKEWKYKKKNPNTI